MKLWIKEPVINAIKQIMYDLFESLQFNNRTQSFNYRYQ